MKATWRDRVVISLLMICGVTMAGVAVATYFMEGKFSMMPIAIASLLIMTGVVQIVRASNGQSQYQKPKRESKRN